MQYDNVNKKDVKDRWPKRTIWKDKSIYHKSKHFYIVNKYFEAEEIAHYDYHC